MPKRANYVMVEEDDPHWLQFWNAYPLRVAKKDARKAWAELEPTPELVDRIIEALAWQVPKWARDGYGTPYPASWLRAERWTDEPPAMPKSYAAWTCSHLEQCSHRGMCEVKHLLGAEKYPIKVSA
jgi:hypothetical protein